MEGWIRLHRQSLENGWLKNHKLWVFWTYCLLKATHEDWIDKVGFQDVPLKKGQFVFGLNKASEQTGLSVQEIRTCQRSLVASGNLTIKSTNKFSIITVLNWDIYQSDDIQEQQTKQQTTNNQLTNKEQTTNNIQEQKNKRTKEENNNTGTAENETPKNNGASKKTKAVNLLTDEAVNLLPEELARLPDFSKTFSEWWDYRRTMGFSNTEIVLNKQIKLLKTENNPVECIDQSLRNGWQGLFPVKRIGATNGKTTTNNQSRHSAPEKCDWSQGFRRKS